ncbi:hypothetical protein FA13DRAFT_1728292 [Coprinellus micaceus]|uniref:Uncharacterized protein n=1 Tax=Coprinellus micaceus TaxID=71717 RepID=A0A4Y7TNG6_COPMI|nr:hypothetical protein FA13DRAFT_1728292 [Coprinellus micaceus]
MPFFTSRRTRRTHAVSTVPRTSRRRGFTLPTFGRKNKNRVAGGHAAALSNPHTTRSGRGHAKRELRAMGQGNRTHVPLMTKIKRALGIRSSPRHSTHTTTMGSRSRHAIVV